MNQGHAESAHQNQTESLTSARPAPPPLPSASSGPQPSTSSHPPIPGNSADGAADQEPNMPPRQHELAQSNAELPANNNLEVILQVVRNPFGGVKRKLEKTAMPKALDFDDQSKVFFPHLFSSENNLNYVGSFLLPSCYAAELMDPAERQRFDTWYSEASKGSFDFQKKAHYCKNDVEILYKGCMKFREEFFKETNVNPFKCITIASSCMKVFTSNFLPAESLAIPSPVDCRRQCKTFSSTSIQWLEWKTGEQKIGPYFVDGYAEVNGIKTAFEVYGCLYHGCPRCFMPNHFEALHTAHLKERRRGTSPTPSGIPRSSTKILMNPTIITVSSEPLYIPHGLCIFSPILPHKTSAGKLAFTLCCACAEIGNQKGSCSHSDITEGKQEASSYPADATDEESRLKYIEDYRVNQGVRLNPDKIEVNPAKRQVAKLCTLNSFWGKLAQRNDLAQTTIVSKPDEFFNFMFSGKYTITHFQWKFNRGCISPPNKSCLERVQDKVLYIDTDSLIYLVKGGNHLGDLTDKLGGDTIKEFVALGPKSYAYQTRDRKKVVMRVKGITQTHKSSERVNFDTVKDLVEGFLETWLHNGVHDTAVELPGFQLIRADRDMEAS
ncbi:unnamed protein product [Menidia menidia]|uniref:DNA-directed DNA polymerase n=1 Tax=Menidia menidia TaxID=238744 RepID=A0A8S4BFI3_9TELE|nr:unnamed protein product [Menidia menidia]